MDFRAEMRFYFLKTFEITTYILSWPYNCANQDLPVLLVLPVNYPPYRSKLNVWRFAGPCFRKSFLLGDQVQPNKKTDTAQKNNYLGILKKVIKYQSSTTFQNQNQAFNSLSKTWETVENHWKPHEIWNIAFWPRWYRTGQRDSQ